MIVAPLVGAWIETSRIQERWLGSRRTPRGCVDWNQEWTHTTSSLQSRTPRGCVDWNYSVCFGKSVVQVAPLVGAWIETADKEGLRGALGRRTPRGCVDWNSGMVDDYIEKLSRTPRGCVDWNRYPFYRICKRRTSHPSWVRGLKHRLSLKPRHKVESHPSWVRGLKLEELGAYSSCILSHPSWVRGLKLIAAYRLPPCSKSHPSWVRGLKHFHLVKVGYECYVAPLVGAWIETSNRFTNK